MVAQPVSNLNITNKLCNSGAPKFAVELSNVLSTGLTGSVSDTIFSTSE